MPEQQAFSALPELSDATAFDKDFSVEYTQWGFPVIVKKDKKKKEEPKPAAAPPKEAKFPSMEVIQEKLSDGKFHIRLAEPEPEKKKEEPKKESYLLSVTNDPGMVHPKISIMPAMADKQPAPPAKN